MSIEKEIDDAIDSALDQLNLKVRFDSDNDLEITLLNGQKELSQVYIDLGDVLVKK